VPDKYLVILDTVALVQSAINPNGAAGKCLAYFEQGKISVAVSRATLAEVKDVLSRPHIRQRYKHITDEIVTGLTQLLLYRGLYVRNVGEHFTFLKIVTPEEFLRVMEQPAP
jgi:predicted nucleic acid-binding protein